MGPENPNADTVDGFHASDTPKANQLVALDSGGELHVPRVYDSDDTDYRLDPALVSELNVIRANRCYDRNDVSYYLSPYKTSNFNNIDWDGDLL
jgi:hypothetical protein